MVLGLFISEYIKGNVRDTVTRVVFYVDSDQMHRLSLVYHRISPRTSRPAVELL